MNSFAEVHRLALDLNMQKYCADIFTLPVSSKLTGADARGRD